MPPRPPTSAHLAAGSPRTDSPPSRQAGRAPLPTPAVSRPFTTAEPVCSQVVTRTNRHHHGYDGGVSLVSKDGCAHECLLLAAGCQYGRRFGRRTCWSLRIPDSRSRSPPPPGGCSSRPTRPLTAAWACSPARMPVGLKAASRAPTAPADRRCCNLEPYCGHCADRATRQARAPPTEHRHRGAQRAVQCGRRRVPAPARQSRGVAGLTRAPLGAEAGA
ncbi:MAG: hypothetical protein QOG99_336 [Frankiales bacterium]|nr:hypothetical protein [Frankiales bacterium]